MNATLTRTAVATATGELIDIPPYVDPDDYRRFAAHIAILPHGGCHLWVGEIHRGQPHWDGRPIVGATRPPVTANARVYAVMARLGPNLDIEPGRPQTVHAACGEPLCIPVTLPALLEHVTLGEERARPRRRHGSDVAVRDALREVLRTGPASPERLLAAYRAASHTPRTPAQLADAVDSLF